MEQTARAAPAYADAVAGFRIETAAAQLHGDLEQGLNACVECCDRHAAANPDAIALDWIDAGGPTPQLYVRADARAVGARRETCWSSRACSRRRGGWHVAA
ncbi:hypothetical protein [Burkholderia vietnamiensis]|uniref:hypothetical protein n=1 Tax=Burkholderia vietnamiensis TaxID=60552 RepID=UPI003BF9098C